MTDEQIHKAMIYANGWIKEQAAQGIYVEPLQVAQYLVDNYPPLKDMEEREAIEFSIKVMMALYN